MTFACASARAKLNQIYLVLVAHASPACSPLPAAPLLAAARAQFRTYKIIYRRYAGLFFSFCVDTGDNELAYLEGIHLFVEMLDRYFGNVCELDLVFNFHKVYAILDECLLAGEMQETSALVILDRVRELEKQMM